MIVKPHNRNDLRNLSYIISYSSIINPECINLFSVVLYPSSWSELCLPHVSLNPAPLILPSASCHFILVCTLSYINYNSLHPAMLYYFTSCLTYIISLHPAPLIL